MDLKQHLTRQAAFSRATFGPGARTKGVCDHIRKELVEVADCYPLNDPDGNISHADASFEWVDVAILSLDGLWRSVSAAHPEWTLDRVANECVGLLVAKQGKNEMRHWPDWRTMSADKAIEHDRTKDRLPHREILPHTIVKTSTK